MELSIVVLSDHRDGWVAVVFLLPEIMIGPRKRYMTKQAN